MADSSGDDILGIHLSPRAEGSSAVLLKKFLEGAERFGAKTHAISITNLSVKGCTACGACYETGQCVIVDDDMGQIYEAWDKYLKIVVASSLFFYDVPSQGKAIIDRSQAFWARRYVLGEFKAGKPGTKGYLLAVGATKGKDLFIPISLSIQYMFDAIAFPKTFPILPFRSIEGPEHFTEGQLRAVMNAGEQFAMA
jgi:multimeric flavodoxin WrbA